MKTPIRWYSQYWLSFLTFILCIPIGAIAGSAQQGAGNPRVVATFLPIYMFTKGVTGQIGRVDILISPNTEVHEYQPTPGNVAAIAQANILIKNGLGIEEFLSGLIANAGNAKLKQIDASLGIETIEEGNPHLWLDPVLAQKQVANIRDGLIAANPANASTYRANAQAYLRQLQTLHKEFEQRLNPLRGCTLISFHDAYPYLAKRYGLRQVAVVELPEDSITPSDIQEVVQTTKRVRVKAFITEPGGVNDQRIQQLAKDLGVPVRSLDPLEQGPLDPQHYFKAMRQNLQTLEAACR